MTNTKEIHVGIKIDSENGVKLFGAEDVDALIVDGWLVTAMKPGEAISKKHRYWRADTPEGSRGQTRMSLIPLF